MNGAKKWHLLEESFRMMNQGFADLGKKIPLAHLAGRRPRVSGPFWPFRWHFTHAVSLLGTSRAPSASCGHDAVLALGSDVP